MYEAKAVLKKTFKAKAKLSSITVNTSGCVDVVVHNSDNSYTESISQAETPFELPDVTHRDSDNQDVVLPAMTPFIATPCKALSAYTCNELNAGLNQTQKDCVYDAFSIAYNKAQLTGQVTTYANYDDGWHYLNGTYNYNSRGVRSRLVNFTTLAANNIFGNTNRFTDINGLQVYSVFYKIDHFTGYGWYLPDTNPDCNWSTAMSDSNTATILSLTGFRIANVNEINTIMSYTTYPVLSYSPFGITSPGINFWTSTSIGYDSNLAYRMEQVNSRLINSSKSTTSGMRRLFVRDHYA